MRLFLHNRIQKILAGCQQTWPGVPRGKSRLIGSGKREPTTLPASVG
jgi:hypothetical protein